MYVDKFFSHYLIYPFFFLSTGEVPSGASPKKMAKMTFKRYQEDSMKGNRTEQITIRFSPEEKERIEKFCAEKDIPVAQYIRALVLKEVK